MIQQKDERILELVDIVEQCQKRETALKAALHGAEAAARAQEQDMADLR